MTPAEATKILDLLPHSTPAQIEARFVEQRTLLEDKAARALTPKLQAQYREALARITEAYETLVLAAEGATLPSLKPAGGPATEAPPAVATRASNVTEAASAAAAVDSFGPWVTRQVSGMLRGFLAVIAGSVLTAAAQAAVGEKHLVLPAGMGREEFGVALWILVAALPGLAWWIYSVRTLRRAALRKLLPAGSIPPERPYRAWFFALFTVSAVAVALYYVSLIRQEGQEEVAKEWYERGHSSESRRNWTDAVADYGQARGLRPDEGDYQRAHELAQQSWLKELSAQLQTLPPEQARAQLTSKAVRPRLWLTSPTREKYQKLYAQTMARLHEAMGKELGEIWGLVAEGKLAEARALVERWRPTAHGVTEFQTAADQVDVAEFDVQLPPVYEAQEQGDWPKVYALLDKLEPKTAAARQRKRQVIVKTYGAQFFEHYMETAELIQKGEFIAAQDKFIDLEVIAQRMAAQEGYAEVMKEPDTMDPVATIAAVRRGWRGELVHRTTAELVEALAASDAPRAQDILMGYAALQGYTTPVTGEALVKEKFFPQFLDYLGILNLRKLAPDEPDSLSCLALVQAALPHFTNPEPARKFLAESYHTLAQWGVKNGVPGLALYLLRESARAGGAADEALEEAALKLFAENNAVKVVFPEFVHEGENATALAEKLYSATKTTLETASRGMLLLSNEEVADEGNPRQFVLNGVLTGIDTTRNQRTEKKTATYQAGSRQVQSPAWVTKQQELEATNTDPLFGRKNLAERAVAAATKSGDDSAIASAKFDLAMIDLDLRNLKTKQQALLRERSAIPAMIEQPALVEQPYEQLITAVNHAATLALTLKHGTLPDKSRGLATWAANLRYATVDVTGDSERGVPVQQAVIVDDAGVSQRLEEDLKAKITAQTPALLWQVVRALHAAKEKQLQQNSSRVRLPGDFEWGWVAFWEKCGVPVPTGAAEAAAREDLGLPAVAATAEVPFVPPAGLMIENSLGMLFTPVPGTKVLCSIWETRVQDFATFSNETGYAATGDMRSLTANGWEMKGDTWRSPGFQQFPTRPVPGVSWHDAKAFCAWLTKKERAAGQMAADREYRLPTAAEWILAAKESPSDTPAAWPRLGAGNLAGSEVTNFPWSKKFKFLSNYRDGIAHTASVGYFSANALGIHDLEGNVSEWCQPEGPVTAGVPVPLLGSSFTTAVSETGGKEPRQARALPELRISHLGFRVVIAPVENQ